MTARKPTALKILQGNPGGHSLPKHEPKPVVGLPKPIELKPYEAEMWDYLAPRFIKQGVATENDAHAMWLLCQTYGLYREACDQFDEQRKDFDGKPILVSMSGKRNPLLNVINDLRADLMKLMAQFGLTPASRAGVMAVMHDEENPWEDFD